MPSSFRVIDLFAGPGGLGEGFASLTVDGHTPFRICISVERDNAAHRTLWLRAFLRDYVRRHERLPDDYVEFHAGLQDEPDWSEVDEAACSAATREAQKLDVGDSQTAEQIVHAVEESDVNHDDTILIGGPPCQAYSLVGRARTRGIKGYRPEDDERHFLFREYIRVLDRIRPAAFVMENVKGLLSSKVESRMIFEMLMEDLTCLGNRTRPLYELRAIKVEDGRVSLESAMEPGDFVVHAEQFGVPQTRHRVIIIGLRRDIAKRAGAPVVQLPQPDTGARFTILDAICNLPWVRSGLSRGSDDFGRWHNVVRDAAEMIGRISRRSPYHHLGSTVAETMSALDHSKFALERAARTLPKGYGQSNMELLRWLENPQLIALAQHETRGHMPSDLGRYLFASVYARATGQSPKAPDFPPELVPDHLSWHTGKFADRFRVQLGHEPSKTVTSHISKDGHYYIHPDPLQCRSLTVREAARLQTFPDDYLFLGNRTEQYIQVGNAVPPYLARQIANLVHAVLDGVEIKVSKGRKSKTVQQYSESRPVP